MKKYFDISNLFDLGLSILLYIFLNILITSMFYFFKIDIGYFQPIFSFVVTIAIMITILLKKNMKLLSIILFFFVFCLILIGSFFVSSKTYDLTYDGNNYHKLAIGQLKDGWNPVYQSLDDFVASNQSVVKSNTSPSLWIDHYAKGYWIFAANLYYITGNIEVGKCLNLLLIITCFLITYSYLKENVSKKIAFLVSILISFNPISIVQLFTFYNDTILSTMIPILIVSILYLFNSNNVSEYKKYILYFLTITLLINIKFTGFAYAGIITSVFYLFILFNSKYRSLIFKKITIVSIGALIIGILLIGFSTYPKNFLEHGHPFYPLYGDNKVDIMTNNQPKSFAERDRLKKFLVANFSKSANIYAAVEMEPTLKIPFTFDKNELLSLGANDLRIGGFGVLFGGILIISSIALIPYIFLTYKYNKKELYKILLPLFSILILILLLEDSWWARYLPQLYIAPLIAILVIDKFKKYKINIAVRNLLFTLVILNISLFFPFNIIPNIIKNSTNINNINYIEKSSGNKNIYVYTNEFYGSIYNIIDKYDNKIIILEKDLMDLKNYKKYPVIKDILNVYIKQ